MHLNDLLTQIKQHPRFAEAGMVLCHNGVVRGTSRDGRPVTGLRVSVDHKALAAILEEQKKRPGILDILVEIKADKDLSVGDDVMYIVVAGDIRENVIASLTDTLNAVKSSATYKTQYFTQE